MGASLNVALTQMGVDEASRTATVNVEVIVTSTSGTHNHYTDATRGATFYLTIDGNTQSYVATFGSAENGTFTTTLYFGGVTVGYNSNGTKTVTASARLITGTAAGTVSGSDSLTLTPISASGGSGGGSAGGDNSEEYNGSVIAPNTGNMALVPGNATIWGQCHQEIMYGGWNDYVLMNEVQVGPDFHPTYYTTVYMVAVIGFTTPKFTGTPKCVSVALEVKGSAKDGILPVNIALCKSDENRSRYIGATSVVNDEHQIAVGSIMLTKNSFCFTEIPAPGLQSETNYYLILWLPSDNTEVSQSYNYCTLARALNHSIDVEYADLSVVYIKNDSGHSAHQCAIDNGAGWDLYDIFVDNGTDWDRIGE